MWGCSNSSRILRRYTSGAFCIVEGDLQFSYGGLRVYLNIRSAVYCPGSKKRSCDGCIVVVSLQAVELSILANMVTVEEMLLHVVDDLVLQVVFPGVYLNPDIPVSGTEILLRASSRMRQS